MGSGASGTIKLIPLQVATSRHLETESHPLPPDRRVIRAAHSLYVNQERLTRVVSRIERASDTLHGYLTLAGVESALLAGYHVSLDCQSGQVAVTKLPGLEAHQLMLPDGDYLIDAPAPAALPPEALDLLERAQSGCLPCPWCEAPLGAEPFTLAGTWEVRLFCAAEACGFEEF